MNWRIAFWFGVNFNWRIAFWFGVVVALVGTVARTTLKEAPEFADAQKRVKGVLDNSEQEDGFESMDETSFEESYDEANSADDHYNQQSAQQQ